MAVPRKLHCWGLSCHLSTDGSLASTLVPVQGSGTGNALSTFAAAVIADPVQHMPADFWSVVVQRNPIRTVYPQPRVHLFLCMEAGTQSRTSSRMQSMLSGICGATGGTSMLIQRCTWHLSFSSNHIPLTEVVHQWIDNHQGFRCLCVDCGKVAYILT